MSASVDLFLSAVAERAGGTVTKHVDLEPGDRFKLFVNLGCPEAEVSVDPVIYVHDRFGDGFAHCHCEFGGEYAQMTGECDVVKLPGRGKVKTSYKET